MTVSYFLRNGHIYLTGWPNGRKHGWLANLAADPHLIFHLRDHDLPARARIIEDLGERGEILSLIYPDLGRGELVSRVAVSPPAEVTIEELLS